MHRVRHDGGFTLAEMLVSLALLGIAAVLMVQGFGVSRGVLSRLRARDWDTATVASAQLRLRASLAPMAVRARFETQTPYVEIDGEADRLDFLSHAPLGAVELTRTERLALRPGGDLTLESAEIKGRGMFEEVLLHDVAAFDIAYFGRDGGSAAPAWRNDWVRQPSPPELVRVRVAFDRSDRRTWPELIVRVGAEVDSECVIDADTAQCRGRA